MGIDLEHWAARLVESTQQGCSPTKSTSFLIDLARDVFADEAAKASAPAASGPELDEPAQRAEGVPELFVDFARSLFLDGETCAQTERRGHRGWITILYEEWPKLLQWMEAEITRRVAEDRRDALCHCQKKMKEARDERDAARAEVERLKKTVRKQRRAIHDLQDQCDEEVERFEIAHQDATDSDKEVEEKNKRIAELEARVTELCGEIERLSRPVEDRPTLDGEHIFHGGTHWINHDSAVRLIQRERNAREAAEASLAELREFVKTRQFRIQRVTGLPDVWLRGDKVIDADLDAALADFRKTKEPAK